MRRSDVPSWCLIRTRSTRTGEVYGTCRCRGCVVRDHELAELRGELAIECGRRWHDPRGGRS